MNRTELERDLLDQPVKELQYMLGRLRERYPFLPIVEVDGEFGENTLEAVMLFQRELLPPVTGVVDRRTWEAVRDLWLALETEQDGPRSARIFPGEGIRVEPGERREFMILPQTMFRVLGGYFEGLRPCEGGGYHGPASEENVRWLQRAAGLEETGVMDREAWDALSRLYEVFVVRDIQREGTPGEWG